MKYLGGSTDPKSIVTLTQLGTKQDTLVSGTNIKTINGVSILSSGDLALATAAEVGDIATALNTINGV